MMKLLVNVDGETSSFNVDENATLMDLKKQIDEKELYDAEIQRLYLGEVEMTDDNESLRTYGVIDGCFLNMKVALCGGAGAVEYLPHLKELAIKFRCDRMICRKCYARLPMNAHNCRKRKCGHSANIRPKKKIKENEGKK